MMIFTGCTPDDGDNGADGTDGLTALIKTTTEPAGDNCAEGGTRIDVGFDDDGNGSLSIDEIFSTEYVCNGITAIDGVDGINGTDGLTALINTTTEPAGANCAEGGVKIDVGLDDDANGTLEPDEIDNTSYVCNGATGIDGVDGEDGADGEDGTDGRDGIDGKDGTEAQCLSDAGYGTIEVRDEYGFLISTWLDRNLGASKVADNENDTAAFGNYYQWSRGADGHENNESDTNETQLAEWLNSGSNGGQFIIGEDNDDWTSDDVSVKTRSRAWETADHPNQVCPCGYVVPSQWDFQRVEADANLTALRLPNAGYRFGQDGTMGSDSDYGYYWTHNFEEGDDVKYVYIRWGDNEVFDAISKPSRGIPVRCIKPRLEIPQ